MKRFIAVLAGLLTLPAFAEVAPISYEEIMAFSDDEFAESDNGISEPKDKNVVTPVATPSRAAPRGVATSGRSTTARAVPTTTGNTSSRNVTGRGAASSRNAVQARTTTTRPSATAARATTTGRVASRAGTTAARTATTSGVTSRTSSRATNANAARASIMQTDTVNQPLYTARVSTRNSTSIQARSPVAGTISAGATTVSNTTDVTDLDELAQVTDYCKAQYTACMDNYCNVLDDNQGRCSCSKNLKNYEKTETALKEATEALQDVAQQIQYIGLTGDEIETLFTQTEAEIQMQSTKDNTQLKNDLDKIKDLVVNVKTKSATSSETSGLSFDLSGLLDFNISGTGFDLTSLFGTTSNTNSINNQRGEQLYKTATARCKASVLNTCQNQGVDISIITNSYDLEIDKQCIAYERQLNDANDNMTNTVRNAKNVLQKARLMVAQEKNSYGLRECINALDSCMQDDFVCGSDYENCLDPTGKYIVNGEIVVGSTPGAPSKINGKQENNLYAVWNYQVNNGNTNAWANNATLSEFITASLKTTENELNKTPTDIAHYLQSKIGYYNDKDGKNYGMCVSVLNKCQDYSYSNTNNKKAYKFDNQVIQQYMQRTLVQIKSAQDNILADYAEDCVQDVISCLSQNNYTESRTTIAIGACNPLIKTCMSVNGYEYSDNQAKIWVQSINADDNTVTLLEKQVNCNSGGKWNETEGFCECPDGLKENKLGKCVTQDQLQCEESEGTWKISNETGRCECNSGYTSTNNVCVSNKKIACETTNKDKGYVAGTWTQNANSGDWFCQCNNGYELNTTTGYCSPEGYSSCVSQGLGTWNWTNNSCKCEYGIIKSNGQCPDKTLGDKYSLCVDEANATNPLWRKGEWINESCTCSPHKYSSSDGNSYPDFKWEDGKGCILVETLAKYQDACTTIGGTWNVNGTEYTPYCNCPTNYKNKGHVILNSTTNQYGYSMHASSAICIPENVRKCETGRNNNNQSVANWKPGYWNTTDDQCHCIGGGTVKDGYCQQN